MAITKEKKNEFNEAVVEFKSFLDSLTKEASIYKMQAKKSKDMESYINFALAINTIKSMNTCLLINDLSVHLLEINNNNYLEQCRKDIYNCIGFIEKTVGTNMDGSLNENLELLQKISEINPTHRLNFVKALKDTIRKTVTAFGPNSKWKWSWPEIHYRTVRIAKNIFDFRGFEASTLDDPFHYIRKEHFNLIIESGNQAAQDYRQKFDMSTQDTGDLKKSVELLDLNRRIFQITGETDDLDKTKTIIESLQSKIEAKEAEDMKKKKKK